jgi:hypothetical protein
MENNINGKWKTENGKYEKLQIAFLYFSFLL